MTCSTESRIITLGRVLIDTSLNFNLYLIWHTAATDTVCTCAYHALQHVAMESLADMAADDLPSFLRYHGLEYHGYDDFEDDSDLDYPRRRSEAHKARDLDSDRLAHRYGLLHDRSTLCYYIWLIFVRPLQIN